MTRVYNIYNCNLCVFARLIFVSGVSWCDVSNVAC